MVEMKKPFEDVALAGAVTQKVSEENTLHKRIEKYSRAKQRQGDILKHLVRMASGTEKTPVHGFMDYEKIISDVGECFNYLVFNHYYTVDKLRLVRSSSCRKHLLCAPCAIRRAAKATEAYYRRYLEITAQSVDLRPYLLTLTVKNGKNLKERFNHLKKAMSSVLKSRQNYAARGDSFNEFCKIEGGVYSYEFSYSQHGWHPHIHIVVMMYEDNPMDFNPKNPKRSKLSLDWKKITGDSFIVDVRPISQDAASGFVEVFKYALKFSDMTPSQTVEAFSFLRGKRLQGSFGVFRGVEVPENMNDEEIANLPYIELLYRYTGREFSLTSTKNVEI